MRQWLFTLFDSGNRTWMIDVGYILDWHDLWFGAYIDENDGQPTLYLMVPIVGIFIQKSSRVWRR